MVRPILIGVTNAVVFEVAVAFLVLAALRLAGLV